MISGFFPVTYLITYNNVESRTSKLNSKVRGLCVVIIATSYINRGFWHYNTMRGRFYGRPPK